MMLSMLNISKELDLLDISTVTGVGEQGDVKLLKMIRHFFWSSLGLTYGPSYESLVEAGVDRVCKCYLLVQGCRGGWALFVDALIKAGINVNGVDCITGDTSLMAAVKSGSIDCIKTVLQSGAYVNRSDRKGYSAIEVLSTNSQMKNCVKLLGAAGEMISPSRYRQLRRNLFPSDDDEMEDNTNPFENSRLQLKHTCRETIRKYLLGLDPQWNLFDRIHLLFLPSILKEYLLFDISLEPEDDSQNIMDDETLMMLLESMQIKDDEQKTV